MTLLAHGFKHPESGQGIDEGRRPVLGDGRFGQDEACGSIHRSVLRVHSTAGDPAYFSQKSLRR